MALKNLAAWNNKNSSNATAACGTACGAGKPNPEPKPAACGSACGAGK